MSWRERHPLAIPWAYISAAWLCYMTGFGVALILRPDRRAFWLEMGATLIFVMLCVTWRPQRRRLGAATVGVVRRWPRR